MPTSPGALLGRSAWRHSEADEHGHSTLPPGYTIGVTGQGNSRPRRFGNIFLSLALAVMFVYIVLAAQFESFTYPFSIMLALPMSLIGAILALLAFKSSLSMMSLIGIIMLMGLVTKNGILLVDYANVLRERGLERTRSADPGRRNPASSDSDDDVCHDLRHGARWPLPSAKGANSGLPWDRR